MPTRQSQNRKTKSVSGMSNRHSTLSLSSHRFKERKSKKLDCTTVLGIRELDSNPHSVGHTVDSTANRH